MGLFVVMGIMARRRDCGDHQESESPRGAFLSVQRRLSFCRRGTTNHTSASVVILDNDEEVVSPAKKRADKQDATDSDSSEAADLDDDVDEDTCCVVCQRSDRSASQEQAHCCTGSDSSILKPCGRETAGTTLVLT